MAERRVAIVTGASAGIGAEIARSLARRGWDIALIGRRADALGAVAAACRDAGARALPILADLADRERCTGSVDEAATEFGRIDALVANAGVTMIARCEDVEDLAIYERLAHVNYLAAAYCTHAALPALLASGGRILAVASVSGLTGVPTRTAYAASKHAMVGFFESLRIELRNRGVSVTIAAPDYVSTRIHERALTADGSELGYSPLRHEHALAAAKCADLLVSAMLSRRRLVLTSFRSRIGRWLRLIAPRLVDRMAARAAVRWR